jgi:hypothetical protein
MVMAKETKNEGPTCACGKVDLYEEWLKQNEDKEKEEASTPASQADEPANSSDTADNRESKAVPAKK